MVTPATTENVPALLTLAKRNPHLIGADESMWLARQLMEKHGLSHLLVLDYDRVIGILSDRDILRCPWVHASAEPAPADCGDTPIQVRHWMTADVVSLNENATLKAAAAQMLEHKVSAFPVLSERSGVKALITEAELVRYFGRSRGPGDDEAFLPVVNYMSTELVLANPEHTLHEAIVLFTDWPIRHLPVVERGRPVGMLSDRTTLAFLAKARAQGQSPFEAANTPVREVMARPVAVINHLFTVTQAIQMMQQRGVYALPVLRDGQVVGIFSTSDVLKLIAR